MALRRTADEPVHEGWYDLLIRVLVEGDPVEAQRAPAKLRHGGRIGTRRQEVEVAGIRHGVELGQARQRRPHRVHVEGRRQDELAGLLPDAQINRLDPFDRVQLAHVVATCRGGRSLSDAGRRLFAVARQQRTSTNDTDRLRKSLVDLSWTQLS